MEVEAEQGYIIVAVNSAGVDYVHMARRLAQSLKAWHPTAMTCLLTDQHCESQHFDFVKLLPHGDLGGYRNDWQVWNSSPFRETVKLEADMLISSEIDHWWTMFRHRDVVISTGCRDFYDGVAGSRFYRRVFDANNLTDVYNAVTYWRKSTTAREFWDLVRSIFTGWASYRALLKFAPEEADTDLVYAMAAEIMGPDRVTLPFASYPRMTHMKQHIIGTSSRDWTQELIWEKINRSLRVNTIAQWGCFHYQEKHWINDA